MKTTNNKNILTLYKMGSDFRNEARTGKSDCQNYRLRAENIKTKDGEAVGADFGFWGNFDDLSIEAWKVSTQNGATIYSAFPYLDNQAGGKRYTTADILKAINAVSAKQFDGVEIIAKA